MRFVRGISFALSSWLTSVLCIGFTAGAEVEVPPDVKKYLSVVTVLREQELARAESELERIRDQLRTRIGIKDGRQAKVLKRRLDKLPALIEKLKTGPLPTPPTISATRPRIGQIGPLEESIYVVLKTVGPKEVVVQTWSTTFPNRKVGQNEVVVIQQAPGQTLLVRGVPADKLSTGSELRGLPGIFEVKAVQGTPKYQVPVVKGEGRPNLGGREAPDVILDAFDMEKVKPYLVQLEAELRMKQQEAAEQPTRRTPRALIRKWTVSADKSTVEAELVEFVDGIVRLRRKNGSVLTVPIEKLIKADQEYIRQRRRQAANVPGSKSRPGPGRSVESTQFRLWRDVTGKHEIQAVFVDAEYRKEEKDHRVTLRSKSGKTIHIRLKKLHKEDRQFIQRILMARRQKREGEKDTTPDSGSGRKPINAVKKAKAVYIVFFSDDCRSGDWHFDTVVEQSFEKARAYLNKPIVQGISIAYCKEYETKTWDKKKESLLKAEKSRILASVNTFRIQEARSTGKRGKKLRFEDLTLDEGNHPFGAKALQEGLEGAAIHAGNQARSVNRTQWVSESAVEGGRVEVIVLRFYHSGILHISVRRMKKRSLLGIVENDYEEYVGKWQQNGEAIAITHMYMGDGWDPNQGARAQGSGKATRSGNSLSYEGSFPAGKKITLRQTRWVDR